MISEFDFSFLRACQEVVLYQQELIPLLAKHFGTQTNEVFSYWFEKSHERQSGVFGDGEWKYFFHGLECDIENLQDGRFLRVDFGPKGRLDTFTGYGIFQFVMVTKSPWQDFPELKAYLAKEPPPYNRFSGSHDKMSEIMNNLRKMQLVEVADKYLCEIYRTTNTAPKKSDGYTLFDLITSERSIISDLGKQVLQNGVDILR